jgi:anti-anti-sigma regulatory factor
MESRRFSSAARRAAAVAALASEPWHVIVAKVRVDSFNYDVLVAQLQRAKNMGEKRIALDLRATRFLSLSAIQFLVQFAQQLQQSGGLMALLAPVEKTKRHFEIYGSLEHIVVFRAGQTVNIANQVELGADGEGTSAAATETRITDPETSPQSTT